MAETTANRSNWGSLGLVTQTTSEPTAKELAKFEAVRPPRPKQDSSAYPHNIENIALWLRAHYERTEPWKAPEPKDTRIKYGWTGMPENPPRGCHWRNGTSLAHGCARPWRTLRTEQPNIKELIDRCARREVIAPYPREEKRRWGDLLVVCDTSPRMIPFDPIIQSTFHARSGQWHDPLGPAGGSYRAVRGGSWINDALYARSAYRLWYAPGSRYSHLGFRCMSSVSQQAERASASTSALRDEAAKKRRTK